MNILLWKAVNSFLPQSFSLDDIKSLLVRVTPFSSKIFFHMHSFLKNQTEISFKSAFKKNPLSDLIVHQVFRSVRFWSIFQSKWGSWAPILGCKLRSGQNETYSLSSDLGSCWRLGITFGPDVLCILASWISVAETIPLPGRTWSSSCQHLLRLLSCRQPLPRGHIQ